MTQESLNFGLLFRARDTRRRIVRIVDDIVDILGLAVAAGAVDMRASELRDAIDGRAGRRLDLEVVLALAAHHSTPAEKRTAIFELVEQLIGSPPRTPTEVMARAQREMARVTGETP